MGTSNKNGKAQGQGKHPQINAKTKKHSRGLSPQAASTSTSATPHYGHLNHHEHHEYHEYEHDDDDIDLSQIQSSHHITHDQAQTNGYYAHTQHYDHYTPAAQANGNTPAPQHGYNQTSHNPHTQQPSLLSTPQTPLHRWMNETPHQSTWNAVASYKPLAVSSAQDPFPDPQGEAGDGAADAYGDTWSVAATWGSGDDDVTGGVRMMRS